MQLYKNLYKLVNTSYIVLAVVYSFIYTIYFIIYYIRLIHFTV